MSQEGHTIGNHTHHHLNGNNNTDQVYLKDVQKAQRFFEETSVLFRPPYGKLSSSKAKKLREKGYKIVMWDVLSADFDQTISKEQCLENVLKNTTNGSIIIFHDSVKAEKNLRYALPIVLNHFSKKGFTFKAIA